MAQAKRRASVAAGACLLAALLVAGCTGPGQAASATATTTAPATPAAAATTTAPATPAGTATATPAATATAGGGGPRPAAPSPASTATVLHEVAAARFNSPVTEVASGPALGDIAVVTANHDLHVFLAGKAQPVVPLVGYAAWVPDSDWVIASRLSQPTIQGSTVLGYRVLLAGSQRIPVPLPACTGAPPQGVRGPAIALVCDHALEVARLGGGGLTPPRTYPWTASLGASRFVVSPDATLAAAVLAKSCHVRVFKLAPEAAWPGTYTAAEPNCPDALAWSPAGTLAIAAFPGVTIWSPGHMATFVKDGDFHALLWTAGGLLAISGTPGIGAWAEVIAPDGTARAAVAPSSPVLGFTADGKHAWLAVSFPGHPTTYGIAATGA